MVICDYSNCFGNLINCLNGTNVSTKYVFIGMVDETKVYLAFMGHLNWNQWNMKYKQLIV